MLIKTTYIPADSETNGSNADFKCAHKVQKCFLQRSAETVKRVENTKDFVPYAD